MVTIPAPMQAPEQLFKPFTSPDWLYELKFDGYRCMAGIEAATQPQQTRPELAGVLRVRPLTKAGRDCSSWFPEIGDALGQLPGGPTSLTAKCACYGNLSSLARATVLHPSSSRSS
jgi:ATP-dependent DNA ligase